MQVQLCCGLLETPGVVRAVWETHLLLVLVVVSLELLQESAQQSADADGIGPASV